MNLPTDPPEQCFLGTGKNDKKEIAQLTVPNALRRPGLSKEFERLDILPDGYSCLDEIIISLLIVERLRRPFVASNRRAR